MDVCSDESIEKAVEKVLNAEGRMDVLCQLNGVKLSMIEGIPI